MIEVAEVIGDDTGYATPDMVLNTYAMVWRNAALLPDGFGEDFRI